MSDPGTAAVSCCRDGALPEGPDCPRNRPGDVTCVLVLQNGAGVGYVGVELRDHVAIFLFNDAAFELHGEGQAAVVEGEVVGEQGRSV